MQMYRYSVQDRIGGIRCCQIPTGKLGNVLKAAEDRSDK